MNLERAEGVILMILSLELPVRYCSSYSSLIAGLNLLLISSIPWPIHINYHFRFTMYSEIAFIRVASFMNEWCFDDQEKAANKVVGFQAGLWISNKKLESGRVRVKRLSYFKTSCLELTHRPYRILVYLVHVLMIVHILVTFRSFNC